MTQKRIERSALLPYSAERLFDLVNDIESYPQFMRGCLEAQVLESGDDWLKGRLTLGKGSLKHAFTTINRLQRPHLIEMKLEEGPFSHLEGAWRFDALGDEGCKVTLSLSFAFKNRLLAVAAGKGFESVASQQVDAICQRAHRLFG